MTYNYRNWGPWELPVRSDLNLHTGSAVASDVPVYLSTTAKFFEVWSGKGGMYLTINTAQFKIPSNSACTIKLPVQFESFTVQSLIAGGSVYWMSGW